MNIFILVKRWWWMILVVTGLLVILFFAWEAQEKVDSLERELKKPTTNR